jgi:hypothetical protein
MIHRFGQTDQIALPVPTASLRSEADGFNPLYQVHDLESADIGTVQRIAKEMINISGAIIKIHTRTSNADIVDTHDEDPDPTYWPPRILKGVFAPQPLEFELTQWGVDAGDNKTEITFHLGEIWESFGDRLLRPGDLLEVPYNSISEQKPKYYRINNAQESGNYRYTWLYLKCQTTLLLGDVNLRPATDAAELVINYPEDV